MRKARERVDTWTRAEGDLPQDKEAPAERPKTPAVEVYHGPPGEQPNPGPGRCHPRRCKLDPGLWILPARTRRRPGGTRRPQSLRSPTVALKEPCKAKITAIISDKHCWAEELLARSCSTQMIFHEGWRQLFSLSSMVYHIQACFGRFMVGVLLRRSSALTGWCRCVW